MCGIAGITGQPDSTAIKAMVTAMHHRGPDDNGTWGADGLFLGMARLSIMDLSPAGHQPMFSADGRYAIVFNGEVYNFRQLRSEFLKGQSFASDGDTEVILKMYMAMGEKCLQHFRGMFAILIYDNKEKTLFGARDRMGIKPLLYYHTNNTLAFASELKCLLASGKVPFDIEEKALADLYMYGSVQFPKTFVKDVFSVPPASYFVYSDGDKKLDFKNYWSFPTHTNTSLGFEDAVEQFRNVYNESVGLRMISDRKVGVFLSSGLDSVSILANLRSQNIDNVRSFTIGFEDEHKKFYSETEHAKKLSHHFGYENDSVIIGSKDVAPFWDEFIFGLDQPSIDGLNTFLVSQHSRNFLTVALSGLGGDELMLGYPRNVNLFNLHEGRPKPFGALSDYYLNRKAYKGSFKSNKYLGKLYQQFGGSKNIELNYWAGKLLTAPYLLKGKLSTAYSEMLTQGLVDDFFRFDNGYSSNLMNELSYYEMRTFMLSQLLRDMDALSMSQSIEVRFPMIDHKLVEFLFSLPAEFKYSKKSGKTNYSTGKMTYEESGVKYLLAEAYKKELPKDYLKTPKQGFQLPVYDWVSKIVKNDFNDIVSDPALQAFFDKNYIEATKKSFAEKDTLTNDSYLLLVFSQWYSTMRDLISKNKTNNAVTL